MNKHPFENIPERKSDTISTEYTEQFEAWLRKAKSDGLQYVNIFYGEGLNGSNINYESFCEEFMKMHNSPDLPDPEVLGRRSI